MRITRITPIAVVSLVITAVATDALWAQQPPLSLSPDRVLKGTAPTITITLDKSIKEIKNVRVAGIDVVVPQPDTAGRVPVQLPKLDITGRADVVVITKDDRPVARAPLTYVESEESPSVPPLGPFRGLVLLVVYVSLIVLLPVWATMYDMYKSYEERLKPVAQTKPSPTGALGAAGPDEGPTGFVGLTRGLIALTLILILAFALFHLMVFPPPKVPDVVDKLLMLLAGTLTAITGFYFGSKTAQEAAAAATTPKNPPGGPTTDSGAPTISGVVQGSGPDKTQMTITGSGFGQQKGKGSVSVNGQLATIQESDWSDTKIKATLPAIVQGRVTVAVVVTTDNGTQSSEWSLDVG